MRRQDSLVRQSCTAPCHQRKDPMAATAAVSTVDIEARLDCLIAEAQRSNEPTPLTRDQVIPGADSDEKPFSDEELRVVFRKLLLEFGVSKERVMARSQLIHETAGCPGTTRYLLAATAFRCSCTVSMIGPASRSISPPLATARPDRDKEPAGVMYHHHDTDPGASFYLKKRANCGTFASPRHSFPICCPQRKDRHGAGNR